MVQMGETRRAQMDIRMLSEPGNDMVGVATTKTFEPIPPTIETGAGMLVIVFLTLIATWVWSNQVVPISRTNLALSKRQGPLKEYLDELRTSEYHAEIETTTTEATTTITTTNNTEVGMANTKVPFIGHANNSYRKKSRAFERWLFADWLRENKSARKTGRQKEPALPILKNAKWNSGDNPILVATAFISLGVLITSIAERITTVW